MHSMPFSFSNFSQSLCSAASIIITGIILLGHTLTHLPQRIQGVGSMAATWSLVKQVSAELVLLTGMSRSNSAWPIMGPPDRIFSGSVLKPPAASISSW